jgi:hypothetical protein
MTTKMCAQNSILFAQDPDGFFWIRRSPTSFLQEPVSSRVIMQLCMARRVGR